MASRSIPVQFRVDDFDDRTPETHTINISEGGSDAPTVLENPHVDFPGVWRLAATNGPVPVYELANQVADTSDTADLGSGHPSGEVTTATAGRIDRHDVSTGGVVDDGRRGDGTVEVGETARETLQPSAPGQAGGDVHWVEPVQVTSRTVDADDAALTADVPHVRRDSSTADTFHTEGTDGTDGTDYSAEGFGVADRSATPDDTVVRQPGIREVDDRLDGDTDLTDGVPPRATRNGEVLLQNLGDENGDDAGTVSTRAIRDQQDATRIDGGTGR